MPPFFEQTAEAAQTLAVSERTHAPLADLSSPATSARQTPPHMDAHPVDDIEARIVGWARSYSAARLKWLDQAQTALGHLRRIVGGEHA